MTASPSRIVQRGSGTDSAEDEKSKEALEAAEKASESLIERMQAVLTRPSGGRSPYGALDGLPCLFDRGRA